MLMNKGLAWPLGLFSLWHFKYNPPYTPEYSSIRVYTSLFKCVSEPQGGWHVGRVLRGKQESFLTLSYVPEQTEGLPGPQPEPGSSAQNQELDQGLGPNEVTPF